MATEVMQTFTALLALAAIAGVVVLSASLTCARTTAPGQAVVETVRENASALMVLLTGTAMVGSLWFSEVAHYVPCSLCWYQRIAMYSMAVIAAVSWVRHEARVIAPYVLTLAVVGACISTYHYLVEWFPTLESSVCAVDVPCTTIWFRKFGFITLPFMAGITFLATGLVAVAGRKS
jgi:disulfide bond formation protein DsbB